MKPEFAIAAICAGDQAMSADDRSVTRHSHNEEVPLNRYTLKTILCGLTAFASINIPAAPAFAESDAQAVQLGIVDPLANDLAHREFTPLTTQPCVDREDSGGDHGVLLASALGSPAFAEDMPLRVGIIDTPVAHLPGVDKSKLLVENHSFLSPGEKPGIAKVGNFYTHGELVSLSFIQRAHEVVPDRKIAIFAAQTFARLPDPLYSNENRYALDFAAAIRSLDWFKENNVRVVIVAFVGPDSTRMQAFIERARELNIVLFAATNNEVENFVPFPARSPYTISITGAAKNTNLDFSRNRSMATWVSFQEDASLPKGISGVSQTNGSSFAVGRAAVYGALIAHQNPTAARDEIEAIMRDSAPKGALDVHDLSSPEVSSRFKQETVVTHRFLAHQYDLPADPATFFARPASQSIATADIVSVAAAAHSRAAAGRIAFKSHCGSVCAIASWQSACIGF